ncbi:hypothetical protein BP6252_13179 [Coleophoma cylindrospora]|uniref:BZIP domain-containing protein n=1 Tax=Coleophoma cylindrospora TaxID=1849047 RepID=A0A3D8QA34_9HELO|nr:hypothetical protein BP6252_13179 [Coleophoma cylindrospora]
MSMIERRREQNKLAQRRFRQRYQYNGNGKSVNREHSQVPLPSIDTAPLSRPPPPPSVLSTEILTSKYNSVPVPASSSSDPTASTASMTSTTGMLRPISSSSPSVTKSSVPRRYCSDALLNCLRLTDMNDLNNLDGSRSPLELDSMTTASLSCMLTEQPFLHNRIHYVSPYSRQPSFVESARGGDSQGASTVWASSLNIAAQKGNDRIVRVLLQHSTKSNVNVPDSEGRTPLICATIGGHKDVVALLLADGALLSCVDHSHRSAIHWAVVHRRDSLLELLLSHGQGEEQTPARTVIDAYDLNGQTPLHLAIDEDFEDGVRLLLEYGANMNLVARRSSVGP